MRIQFESVVLNVRTKFEKKRILLNLTTHTVQFELRFKFKFGTTYTRLAQGEIKQASRIERK